MMITDPQTPLIALLGGLRDAIGAELHARLRELGFAEIRPAHGCVFGNIQPDGSRLTELADRSGITKQSVGEAVADLERLGFVERVPDPDDGRAKIIRLTPHGAEAMAAAQEIFDDIEGRLAEELGHDNFHRFRETLVHVHELMQPATEAAPRAA
jgi:DNA-binding MarR family transcriptional regulator